MGRSGVIGLDIGSSAVRAAEVDIKRNPPVLTRFGQVMLPPGAVADGEIIEEQAVGETIADLWKRVGFRSRNVIAGVANQRVIVRQIEMPYMEEPELESSLPFQVQEQLPIPVDEAILDFQVLEEIVTPDNERLIRLLLVAAQRDMIESLLRTLDHAGLNASIVDLVPLALLRTLGEPGQSSFETGYGGFGEGAEAIVDIGAGVTNIVVHENGMPRFVRILVSGGQHVTDALATALQTSPEEAELLKRQAAFGGVPEEATRIIEDRTNSVLEEVRGSLDYYSAQPESTALSRVVLTGGGSCIEDLAPRLATATGVATEYGHPLASVSLGPIGLTPEQLAEAEPLISVPVGLALGERQ
ncbi:MAG: type IV pilus assembly protein PilM [Acidimicrobiia bacterium]|nr:type IV pilus assembly protein PilM [Acidimicrobiia bacterium]